GYGGARGRPPGSAGARRSGRFAVGVAHPPGPREAPGPSERPRRPAEGPRAEGLLPRPPLGGRGIPRGRPGRTEARGVSADPRPDRRRVRDRPERTRESGVLADVGPRRSRDPIPGGIHPRRDLRGIDRRRFPLHTRTFQHDGPRLSLRGRAGILGLTRFADDVLDGFTPGEDFYRVVAGQDRDGDGRLDAVSVLE